jgi:hypothetical protein
MTTLMRIMRNSKTWWKKICISVIIIALIGSAILVSPLQNKVKASGNPISLFYTVTIPEKGNTFHIHISIQGLLRGMFKLTHINVNGAKHPKQYHNISARQGNTSVPINVVYLDNKYNITWWQSFQNGGSLDIDYDVDNIVLSPQSNNSSSVKQPHDVNVYIDNQRNCGMIYGAATFLIPCNVDGYYASQIKIKFEFPKDKNWKIVCPYKEIDDDTYVVAPTSRDLIVDFASRRGIYFGKMKFFSEKKVGNCTIEFGILEADESYYMNSLIKNQNDLDHNVELTSKAVVALTKMFGNNPYPVIPIADSIIVHGYRYPSGAGIVGGNQYWPSNRYDETVGHLFYSWMRETYWTPTGSNYLICKGIGEFYYGNKIAYEVTKKRQYLGKIYANYLVYKRALGTRYFDREEIKDAYYRGMVVGLYLDKLIQKETQGTKSLDNVMGYLYKKYKNTGHEINNKDLEAAINIVTGQDNSDVFNKYVYGDNEIPVQDYIQPYKSSFPDFIKILNSDEWPGKNYHGYTIPFFVDLEMAIRSPIHLPVGILVLNHYDDFAKYVLKNYDIDTLTKEDMVESLNKLTSVEDNSDFFEQWKDSYGELSLEEMKEWLKSYLPYPPTNLEATFKTNSVRLKWDRVEWRYVSSYYLIIGYEIYRGTSSGEEVLIATVGPSNPYYTDTDIEIGKTPTLITLILILKLVKLITTT